MGLLIGIEYGCGNNSGTLMGPKNGVGKGDLAWVMSSIGNGLCSGACDGKLPHLMGLSRGVRHGLWDGDGIKSETYLPWSGGSAVVDRNRDGLINNGAVEADDVAGSQLPQFAGPDFSLTPVAAGLRQTTLPPVMVMTDTVQF